MLLKLHADRTRLISVRRLFFGVIRLTRRGRMLVMPGTMGCGAVRFVELFGAVGAFEFMAFARHGEDGNGHKQEGE
jgi:hypothetical protein